MTTKGGHIYFMFLPPPYPATGSATGQSVSKRIRIQGILLLNRSPEMCAHESQQYIYHGKVSVTMSTKTFVYDSKWAVW